MPVGFHAPAALRSLGGGDEGQTTAEYAVVVSMITAAIVGVFVVLSGAVSSAVQSVTGAI